MCDGGWENLCLNGIDNEWWGIVIEVFLFIYSMIAIAIVADEYLVVSLETVCVRWHVREDVAGATLMALGSAAPEIIINAISTIKGGSDLGVGAIVGSGMIAFLVIPSVSAIFAPDGLLELKRRPLTRDIVVYATSLALLCVFFHDGVIQMGEAVTLCSLYVLYLLIVVFSPRIRRQWRLSRLEPNTPAYNRIVKRKSFVLEAATSMDSPPANSDGSALLDSSFEFYGVNEQPQYNDNDVESSTSGGSVSEEPTKLEVWYDRFVSPLTFLFEYTCPKCHFESEQAAYYPITFVVSFVYIAVFSFVVSTVVERWVDLTGVSLSFFGLVLVAVGAEIPDTIQSVTVAKRGYGSMAVSNCIGSQITNILVGLGVPWLISNLISRKVKLPEHKSIQKAAFIQSFNVTLTFVLLIGVALCQGTQKALLTKSKGYVLLVFYVIALSLYAVLVFVHF